MTWLEESREYKERIERKYGILQETQSSGKRIANIETKNNFIEDSQIILYDGDTVAHIDPYIQGVPQPVIIISGSGNDKTINTRACDVAHRILHLAELDKNALDRIKSLRYYYYDEPNHIYNRISLKKAIQLVSE